MYRDVTLNGGNLPFLENGAKKMRVVLELEIGDGGKVTRVRLVNDGKRAPRKVRRSLSAGAVDDSEELRLVREFVAAHGAEEGARMLGVSRAAIYQWIYRGRVPGKHVEHMCKIMC